MKTFSSILFVLLFCLSTVQAQTAGRSNQRFGAGVRYHAQHDTERETAFDDESTFGLVYEYHEGSTFWQLGVQYGNNLGTNTVDYIITPEINLMVADGLWRGGIGILSTYSNTEDDSDWSDLYYQFLLGVDVPIGSLALSFQAAYVFEDFDELDEFDFDELDWTGYLTFVF